MRRAQTIICTVGTSLFKPNLFNLPTDDQYDAWLQRQPPGDRTQLPLDIIQRLRTHLAHQNWAEIAQDLTQLSGSVRLCGAEINSVQDLILHGYCESERLNIFLCHSATTEARQIAKILKVYFRRIGKNHQTYTSEVEGLVDSDPKIFRTIGLRNLVKSIGQIYRSYQPNVAINATGGYKAQIAIAVLVGQALGIPVYYKHERFSEIIPFPPMPIDFDLNLWLKQYHWFHTFENQLQLNWDELKQDALTENWDERMEPLVEKESIDGQLLIGLSPVGQIFHERFKQDYAHRLSALLPLAAEKKTEAHLASFETMTLAPCLQTKEPSMSQHGWKNARHPTKKFMQRIVDEAAYVKTCTTHYWNPDLAQPIHFRLTQNQIEGIYSNGSWTVKFYITTTATTDQEKSCAVVDLNQRFAT